jgi:hypothetical protein
LPEVQKSAALVNQEAVQLQLIQELLVGVYDHHALNAEKLISELSVHEVDFL